MSVNMNQHKKVEANLEGAVWVVDLEIVETVLGFALEIGLESVQGLDQGPGLGSGWESDRGSRGLAQEFDLDMELGKCQVCQGLLGHDQVQTLHRSRQVSGCTVSGTPLKLAQEKTKRR